MECGCRKPAPGMLLRALGDYRLDASTSFLVGDSTSDIQAAWLRASARPCAWKARRRRIGRQSRRWNSGSAQHATEKVK
ncbi:HAD hydrolase-like protein [Pseudoxanthomonas sp. NC8]|nr:HAD hydrolase-like protein [Pseudoxanthomonas sp. NC8]